MSEEVLCRICNRPVNPGGSMGGPDICGACDCGFHRCGCKWTYAEFVWLCKPEGLPRHEPPPHEWFCVNPTKEAFAKGLAEQSKDLDPEFRKVIDQEFWNLL